MSRRRLSDEERTLWKGVARSITPLRKARRSDSDADAPEAGSPAVKVPVKAKPRSAPLSSAPPPPAKPAAPPPLASLGRRRKQRIARGRDGIDGRLDLHGMTQAEAHSALFGFLHARQASGCRLVLVITGKGGGAVYEGRGVLKRLVPMWLGLPEFRTLVVGFDTASIGHGGEGALYVSLRRSR